MSWLLLLLACGGKPDTVPVATPPHAEACPDGRQPGQPDVILLTIDTLRADRLGYAGYASAQTSHLDALAARGQAFLQATTPLPRTTPALASLLTGLQPHHHGSREVGDRVTVDRTLATQLRNRGWRTVGVSAMQVVSPDQGLDVGFQAFEVHHDARAQDLSATALALADEVPGACPLMLWIHYADPHFPYLPPAGFPQPKATKCRALGKKAAAGKLRRVRLFSDKGGLATEILPECSQLYDAEIGYVDTAVGTLLSGLADRGRTDPLVVFTADHGENLGEWGLFFEHGPNVHDASLRVPLVIAGPGIPPARSEAVARLEDVVPTLEALLQIPADERLPTDGEDLSARWRTGAAGPQLALGESGSALHARLSDYLVTGRKHRMHCINGPRFSLCRSSKRTTWRLYDRTSDPHLQNSVLHEHPAKAAALREAWTRWPVERTRQRVARTERFSLVARPQLAGGYASALYDHRADPAMRTDVSTRHPEEAARLQTALTAWAAEVDANQTTVKARSRETEEAMRSLGYIE